MPPVFLRSEELHYTANYLRQLSRELDHVRWRLRLSWQRLDTYQYLPAELTVESFYRQTDKEMALLANALHQSAWVLEAAIMRLEEADRRSAAGFTDIVEYWGSI